jgi:oxygen-independent coproporphyrinogen-3 oxidase
MKTIGKKPISLYFHIPFCKKKCPYCHFFVLKENETQKDLLMAGLFKEFKLHKIDPTLEVISIYFGGGTPSLMGPVRIKRILEFVSHQITISDQCEITLEVNPSDVTQEDAIGFYEAGINRVSIGVQSFDDESLKIIGREHKAKDAVDTIHYFHQAGICNISIDLMYDRPYQELKTWEKELSCIKNLPITHLSLYNMTIEEGSAYKRLEKKILKTMPDEELSLKLYQQAIDSFKEMGFDRYEISAFCKNNKRSIHNLGYWQGRDFYGLGPSSFSLVNKKRFQNVSSLKKYLDFLSNDTLPVCFEEKLDPIASLKEHLCIALRVKEGVFIADFEKQFQKLPKETLLAIDKLQNEGLLSQKDGFVCLTEKGMLFFNEVGASLI